jgi:hypothetical protein
MMSADGQAPFLSQLDEREGDSHVSTLIYCDSCKKMQPLGIADMRQNTRFEEQGVGGDLICTECFSVITSLCVKEPGIYRFVKVSELDDQWSH